MPMDTIIYYIAVDVGTSSVRTAVVDRGGKIISFASEEIRIWQPSADMYEQSSDDIWICLFAAVKVGTHDVANYKQQLRSYGELSVAGLQFKL